MTPDRAVLRLSPYFTHLRLPFQLLLSPVFLWGFLLADGRPGPGLVLAYVSFHIFGYAGGTALNSYYDRDEGPIGGLAAPPPVPVHLLEFSLAWQLAGFLLALAVNPVVAAIYGVMFLMSAAYSHPRLRWKGNPFLALLTVACGQGMLAFAGGWATARGNALSALSTEGIVGALAATLIIVGFYPLTESYQMEEDARRGDRTLARYLGVRGSFRMALVCIGAGGCAAIAVTALQISPLEALLLVPFLAALLFAVYRWGVRFENQTTLANYRTTMQLYAAATLPFLAWILYHLIAR